MGNYRLYFLDGAGRSYQAIDLDSDNDQQAMQRAQKHAGGRAMALWCGARVVKTYPAEPSAAEPPAAEPQAVGATAVEPPSAERPDGES